MHKIARICVLVLAANLLAGSGVFAAPTFTIINDVHTCGGQSNGAFDIRVTAVTGAPTTLQFQVFILGTPTVTLLDTTIPIPGAFPFTFPVSGLAAGDYVVRVTQSAPSSSTIHSITITDFTVTFDSSTPNTDVDCDNPDGTISVTTTGDPTNNGAVSWTWTGPDGPYFTEDLTGLRGGDYSLSYTDGTTTCTLGPFHIDDPEPPPFGITSPDAALCVGEALVVDIDVSDASVTYEVVNGATVLATSLGNGGALQITVPAPTVTALGAGTYTIRVQASQGCPVIFNNAPDITLVLDDNPTITGVVDPQVCFGATTANLTYAATTGSPDLYSIAFGPAALAAGFINVTNAVLAPPAAIVITVPGTATAATYDADLTVSNGATGCLSVVEPMQITIHPAVSITPDPVPAVCAGTTTVNLTFTGPTGGADQYAINYDVTAEGQGFVDVTTTGPLVSPIALTIPALAAASTYNAVVTISNSTTTCFANYPITILVNPNPTIALGANPAVCQGTTSANLTYTATTAEEYTIDFGAAANGQGFVDIVAFTPLAVAPSQIAIVVPGAAAPATYDADLTIRDTGTGCTTTTSFQIIVNGNPTITLVDASLEVCTGTTTVNLAYSGTTDSPDQYSIDFDAAANTALFADVVNGSLTGSPIVITVPAAPAAAIYNATLTVRNSTTGCVSAASTPITIEVHPVPTITLGPNPAVCSGTLTANLTYSATTADEYTLDFDATAEGEGFVDVTPFTGLAGAPSQIVIVVPGAAAAATYNASLTIRNSTTLCTTTTAVQVTVNPNPTITAVVDPQVCFGATTANLTYGGTTASPDRYSIAFGAAALADGFIDVTDAVFAPPAAIVITIPGTATATTYDADLTVKNSTTGCVSAVEPIQVIINPNPTITVVDASLEVCSGTTSVNLAYSATTASPDQYSIDFDAAANTALFVDVVNGSLTGTPIAITVPAAAAAAIYNGSLTVRNSTTGCVSTVTAITIEIHANPTITLGPNPAVCSGTLSANLTYSATTADEYTLDFDATAEGEGFVDVTPFTGLAVAPSQIVIVVPGAAAAATYNASLTIRNATTLCTTTTAVQVTVNPNPTITAVVDPQVCFGATTANLTYGGTTASPDRYSIAFGAAALADGFINVTDAVFAPPAAIVITIPGTATATTYDADLTVKNSTTGCVSAVEPIQIIINPAVSITPNPIPAVCAGTTTVNFTFGGPTGGADQYAINYDVTAEGQGFVDVVTTGPLASPIALTIPALAAAATYNAVVTISNSTTTCFATYPITVTVNPNPTITAVVDPQVCFGATTANLTYGGTTASPDRYSIAFGAAALADGFIDVTDAVFAPPAAIVITIPGTATATTYDADLTVKNSTTGCVSAVEPIQVIINPNPTITVVDASLEVCSGTMSVNLAYSATTASPDQYSIDFDAAANTALFVDVVNGSLTGTPIAITVPAAAAPAIYNGSLTVRNSTTGCVSTVTAITIEIHANPTITLGPNPAVCSGTLSANLTYSATTADEYTLDFDATAEGEGFVDVTPFTGLAAAPSQIVIVVPGAAAAATYNASLTIRNSTTLCTTTTAVQVTINPNPTITAVVDPQVCFGATTANLTYGGTTASPDRYSIAFGAAALADGFIDVTDAVFAPPAAIVITIPGTATATTYDADLTVKNSTTGCVSTVEPIQVIINPNPTITVVDASLEVCSGTTSVNLAYSATTASPDQYSIDFDAAANTALFVDVVNGSLTGTPIAIAVPAAAAPAIYNGSLTVRNSTTGCVSTVTAITIEIHANPTITLGPNPAVCSGTLSANLTYSATTADEYTLDFDATAEGEGFVDVTPFTGLAGAPSQIVIVVPGAAAAATYNASLTIRNATTLCTTTTAVQVTVNPNPTITAVVDPQVCFGATTANLTYGGTTASPDRYTIVFGAAAIAAGFIDVTDAVFAPPAAIVITVPGTATVATYDADLTVRNSTTGCVSVVEPIQIIINPAVSITPDPVPAVCAGTTTVDFTFAGLTGGADQYAINFDLTAEGQGFVDVTTTGPLASPIALTIPALAAASTYNAVLTISNSTTTCSATYPITVTVNPNPTIALGANPAVCSGTLSANLTYTATTADEYTLDFDGIAEGEGFVDVTPFTALTGAPSQIVIVVPGAAATGTYDASLTIRNSTTLCATTTAVQVTVNPNPTITAVVDTQVCFGATTASLTYGGTTASPDRYTIVFGAAATAAGFIDVTDAVFAPPAAIVVTIPGTATAATYDADLTVRNSTTGCVSVVEPIQIIINPAVSITPDPIPTVCSGTTTVDLTFTGLAGGADQYAIDFDLTAEGEGFVDVTTTGPLVSPIAITVPALAAAATYNGVLTISNSTTTCSATYPITVTVGPATSISSVVDPQICFGATTANLTYAATAGSPDLYSIVFSPAAIAAGFVDVTDAALAPPADIVITIPGTATATTYSADLTVRNSTSGCVSAVEPIQIIINPSPTISYVDTSLDVCAGTSTVDLFFSGTTDGPDQYSIDFDAAANTALFVDVVNASFSGSPIVIAVPAATAAGIYNATITVRNSVTGCISAADAITIEIHTVPVVSLGSTPTACPSVTNSSLPYTVTAGTPDSYSIFYSAGAQAAGFVNVGPTALVPSPLPIVVPGAVATGTYSAILRVEELVSGCFSTISFSVTVSPRPTIASVVDPQVCLGATTANLTYGATTNGPNRYSIAFGPAALAAGFVDVTDAVFAPPAAIVVTIPGTATPATYDADLTIRNSTTGCVSAIEPIQIIINPSPTISYVDTSMDVCAGTSTVDLFFSGTSDGPDQYSIDFDAAANTALFVDVVDVPFSGSPIVIAVPAATAAGIYNASVTVRNSATGCVSAATAITIEVHTVPVVTLGANPIACSTVTSSGLAYSVAAGAPDSYSIFFSAGALAAGFIDVAPTALVASPLPIAIPAGVANGTYNATLRVEELASGCFSTNSFSITVTPRPTIASVVDPQVCLGATTANLTYGATTNGPNRYSIAFGPAALAAGFIDVTDAVFAPPAAIVITIPGTATAAIYDADFTVRNATTGCVSAVIPITVTVNANPTITLGASPYVCQGVTTANLPYTATTASPDQYTIDFDAAAEAGGFVDVLTSALPATPVQVPVPAAAAMGVYNATITVYTAGTGCVSTATAFTVTVGVDITVGVVAPVCINTSALIPVTPVVGDPDLYSLDFDATAEGFGFVDVVDAALPVGNITVTVPANVAGVFNATLTVRNSSSGCVSAAKPVTLVVGSTIALGADPEVCQGVTSADLTYTATSGGPDQLSIDFDAAAEAAGFVDVVDAALTASPIVITVPGTAPVAIYNYGVTVRNSISGCGSLVTPKTIAVNSLPTANAGLDISVCVATPYFLAGSSVGSTASTGAWTITSQPAGGDGSLSSSAQVADPTTISFTATVPGDYVLTLITDDPAGPCGTAQDDVTITITTIPVLATSQTKAICGNDDVAYEILLNPANTPANTVFNWPDPDGAGPATAGVNVPMGAAGTIHINDRLINFSLVDITVTYQVTPSVGSCIGTMENVDIVVHPSPTIELGQAKTICSGDNVAYEILLNPLNTPAGTTLSWPDPDGAGSGTSQLNIPADPAGTAHINDVLYNGTGAPVDVIYSIIATAPNGCRAIPRDVVITVNPGAVADAGAAQSICSAGTATLTGSSIGGLATTGAWSLFLSPAGGDGVLSDLTQTATPSIVTFTATVAGDYTLQLTTDDPAGSCVNVTDVVVITVRAVGDAGCTGGSVGTGDCTTVVITPKPSPATCSNSDGSITFTIKPFVPAVLTTEVRIDIQGISPSNNTILRTVHNDSTFNGLPVGVYDYTIEYGDPACIKTGQVTIDRSGTVDVPTFSNLVDPLCFGIASGSATIDVAGETGNPLEWSIDGITWTPFIAGNTATGLPGGTNIISVRRDVNDGCASGAMLTLVDPVQITTTLTPADATCSNNDGTITVGTVTGGTGPYTFSLNGNATTIPVDNIIPGLGAGSYNLVITDALGCNNTISATVAFPGFVNHTVPVITHPDCIGGGTNGVISLQITDTGNFEFGVTTDPFAEPTAYSPAGGAQVTVPNLSNGIYAVWLRPTAGLQCATKIGDLNVSGTFPISFQTTNTDVVCLNASADITVTTIAGAPSLDFTYELTNTGDNSITTGTITAAQAASAFTISNVAPGNYSIRLLQDQSSLVAACSAFPSAPGSLVVDGPTAALDTISVTRELSYPDLPTGEARTVINTSGGNAYDLRLELMQPAFPDALPAQTFVQDWTPVTQNATTLKFEYTFDHLFAGIYEMRLRDDFGCEHVYDVTIDADPTLMIPNIFTPNGDEKNDFFYVRNLPAGSSLVVTNRWGKEVYKSGSYDNKWDGGDTADGVYYFQLKTPSQTFNGWVEVFRGL